jgi:hypothetical protein
MGCIWKVMLMNNCFCTFLLIKWLSCIRWSLKVHQMRVMFWEASHLSDCEMAHFPILTDVPAPEYRSSCLLLNFLWWQQGIVQTVDNCVPDLRNLLLTPCKLNVERHLVWMTCASIPHECCIFSGTAGTIFRESQLQNLFEADLASCYWGFYEWSWTNLENEHVASECVPNKG